MKKLLFVLFAALAVLTAQAQGNRPETIAQRNQPALFQKNQPKTITQEQLQEMVKADKMRFEQEKRKYDMEQAQKRHQLGISSPAGMQSPARTQTVDKTVLQCIEEHLADGTNDTRIEYEYDDNGKLSCESIKAWDGEWYIRGKTVYGENDSYYNFNYNRAGDITFGNKTDVTLAEDGTKTAIYYNWSTVENDWIPTRRLIEGSTISESSDWSAEKNDWDVYNRVIYVYDDNGNILNYEYYSKDYDTGELVGRTKYIYSYNEAGLQTYYAQCEWQEGGWVVTYYNEMKYNEKGLTTEQISCTKYGGRWWLYYYNEQDLLETQIGKSRNGEEDWFINDKKVYTYYENGDTKSREFYYYNNATAEWSLDNTEDYTYDITPNSMTIYTVHKTSNGSEDNTQSGWYSEITETHWNDNNYTTLNIYLKYGNADFTGLECGNKAIWEYSASGKKTKEEQYELSNPNPQEWTLIEGNYLTYDDQDRILREERRRQNNGELSVYEYVDDYYGLCTIYNLTEDGNWQPYGKYVVQNGWDPDHYYYATFSWSEELQDFSPTYSYEQFSENGYQVFSETFSDWGTGLQHNKYKFDNTFDEDGNITRQDKYYWDNNMQGDDFQFIGYALYFYKHIQIDGIDAITTADSAIAPAYNLQGMKVGPDYKGIVIRNGKKMVRK